jgi:hypothetical protein
MKNLLSIIVISILAISCGTQKESNNYEETKEEQFKVEITVKEKVPYCGGARPTPEMTKMTKPAVGEFSITNLNDNTIHTVKSDENGVISTELPAGNYSVNEGYNNVTFEKFLEENRDSKPDLEFGDEACYKTWWSTNILEFEIEKTAVTLEQSATIIVRCNTGINPCDKFTGALAP